MSSEMQKGIDQASIGEIAGAVFGHTEFEMFIAYRSRRVKEATGYRNLKFKREVWGRDVHLEGLGI